MLDTRFPRPIGDIGHPDTFPRAGIAVRYRRVANASPTRVVIEADSALNTPFVQAMQGLADEGASLISTSCGASSVCPCHVGPGDQLQFAAVRTLVAAGHRHIQRRIPDTLRAGWGGRADWHTHRRPRARL